MAFTIFHWFISQIVTRWHADTPEIGLCPRDGIVPTVPTSPSHCYIPREFTRIPVVMSSYIMLNPHIFVPSNTHVIHVWNIYQYLPHKWLQYRQILHTWSIRDIIDEIPLMPIDFVSALKKSAISRRSDWMSSARATKRRCGWSTTINREFGQNFSWINHEFMYW